ncbi:unnamed protein product, partial [Prorocentrum cordatum]
ADGPIGGPRATQGGLGHMRCDAGGPLVWHSRWKAEAWLHDSDWICQQHEMNRRRAELGSCYDHVTCAEFASLEPICRQIQLIEELRYEDTVTAQVGAWDTTGGKDKSAEAASENLLAMEADHYMGGSASMGNRATCASQQPSRRVQALRCHLGESCVFVGAALPPVFSRWTLEFASVMCSPYLLWRWAPARKPAAAVGGASAPSARVKPCDKDLVSWPDLSTAPVDVADLVGEAERECLSGWRRTMLKSGSSASDLSAASVPQRPRVDPILGNSPRAYAGFVGELLQGGRIPFRVARVGDPYSLGFFFVEKVGKGALRLVFDTRVANEGFAAPPKTALPTAAARAALESDYPAVLAQGDIQCAFYHMLVPKGMEELFTLPIISNRLLNVKQIDSVAAAGYVDNFAIVGGDPVAVTSERDEVTRALEAWGLPVHSLDTASAVSVFTGLEINGELGAVRVKPASVVRLRQALLAVLRRGAASPRMLEVLLGHIAWTMICKRETLCILSSVYAFKSQKDPGVRPLWASAKFELWCVASILPLWTSHMNIPWGSHVPASDASPIGVGVCTRREVGPRVADIGRQAERWRYRCTAAVSARSSALGLGGPPDDFDVIEGLLDSNPEGFCKGFHEIPEELMQVSSWATVISRRHWNPSKNILDREGVVRGALSFFENAALSDPARARCRCRALRALGWLGWHVLNFSTASQLDSILVCCLTDLSLDGFVTATGRMTVAAMRHLLPLIPVGKRPPPRSVRALDGGRCLMPPQLRLVPPRLVAAAVAGWLIWRNLPSLAVIVALVCHAYFRPSEAYRLRVGSLVPPISGSGVNPWGIVGGEAKSGRRGVAGVVDESVLGDVPELWPVLHAPVPSAFADASLWDFRPAVVRAMFRQALRELGLQ